jgi:hypothetical protein
MNQTETEQASSSLVDCRELNELTLLEKRKIIADCISSVPELMRTDRTLMRWFSGILLRFSDEKKVLERWRNIQHRKDRHFTARQLKEINVPDHVIIQVFNHVKATLAAIDGQLSEELVERVTGEYGHYWNDGYESRQKPKRSLPILQENGVMISIGAADLIAEPAADLEDHACPLLDRVKNKKIATINGFNESKVSLTIHDIFDHYWFYTFLEEQGILDNYADFLQRVGNPQSTDIFSREGELIASVAFDYRTFSVSEADYQPLFDMTQIKTLFEKAKKAGRSSANQERALLFLNHLDPTSEEARCLCFVLSGLTIELMEQRRKHGFIRVLDEEFKSVGVLDVLDAEYLALVVESHHLLFSERVEVDKILLNISVLIEDYLLKVVRDSQTQPLVVTIDALKNLQLEQTIVPTESVDWMRQHLGFAANRRDLC